MKLPRVLAPDARCFGLFLPRALRYCAHHWNGGDEKMRRAGAGLALMVGVGGFYRNTLQKEETGAPMFCSSDRVK